MTEIFSKELFKNKLPIKKATPFTLMSSFSFTCLVLFCLSISLSHAQEPQLLTQRYLHWRTAMLNADVESWQQHTCSARQRTIENEIISRAGTFPNDVFQIEDIAAPSVDNLALVAIRSSDVASHLFYFGRVDFGFGIPVMEIPRGLLMLKFQKEQDQWLFDSLAYYNLADQPQIEAELAAGIFDSLHNRAFAPLESIAELPERVQRPEHVAQLYVRSPFHQVTTRISSSPQSYSTSGDTSATTILGGLNSGQNTLEIEMEQLAEVPTPWPELANSDARNNAPLEISLWLVPAPNNSLRRPQLVWRWTAYSAEQVPELPLNVEINVP